MTCSLHLTAISLASLLAAILPVVVPLSAHAADLPAGYQPTLSVDVGTLGIGPEIGIRIPNSHWGLRANLNLFSYNDDNIYSHRYTDSSLLTGYDVDASFDASLRLLNGGLTADYYPFGSGFRLSAGIYGNGDRLTGQAVPSGDVRIGRTTYSDIDAGTVSVKALTNDVAPYVGLGYAGRLVGNLVFSINAGVLIEGAPRVSAAASDPIGSLPAFTAQLESERHRIASDLDVPVYPVVQIGLGWRF